METESPSTPRPSNRPRPWLLVLLGIATAVLIVMRLGDSTTSDSPSSNAGRTTQQQARKGDTIDPEALDVKIELLAQPPPPPGDTDRNPFRFQPKAPPPAPPQPPAPKGGDVPPPAPLPPPPPPEPEIPLKYIGILEDPAQNLRLAAFTDCKFIYKGVEGQVIAGQYRLVKIGIESAVVEFVDGKGRKTLRMSGQECQVK